MGNGHHIYHKNGNNAHISKDLLVIRSNESIIISALSLSLSSQGEVFLYWFLFSMGACTCEVVSGKKQLGARLTIIIHFAGRAGPAGGGAGGARSIRDALPGSTTLNDVTCGTDTVLYTPLPSVTDIITAVLWSTSTYTVNPFTDLLENNNNNVFIQDRNIEQNKFVIYTSNAHFV